MNAEGAIRAVNIHKAYGNLPVLKGVDLQVKRGEVVAIVGASGAGKSTLLHIIGTLDQPDAGEIEVSGHRTDQLSNKQLANFRNSQIGFVFQFHHLLPEFTALENTYIPALIGGVDEREASRKAEELLTDLGLGARLTHKPAALSGGEQQRVAVARAFINNPAVILADEPSGNLDSDNSRELHELFFKLRDKYGQTFVIVTHNKDLAAMSDRMFHMKDGLIVQ